MPEFNIEIKKHEENYIVENGGLYFKVGIPEGRILERIANSEPEEEILQNEGITKKQLEELMAGFREMGVIGEREKKKNSIFFYRIPLIQADKLFDKIAAVIKNHMLIVKMLIGLSIILNIVGGIFTGVNFQHIFNMSSLKLRWFEYLILYVVFLITVCFHEMGHGIVCKCVGGKVGTVGLMFIFFSPALYCDISGIRMVESKYKQIMTSSAGIYVNWIFTSIASIGFAIYPKPILAAFIIMSITIIVSNLVPFIRLDGYWILSFATGITNLYNKSLKGIGNLFKKCNLQERFIAGYGVLTYGFIMIALCSVCVSAVQAVHYIVNIFI